jgi:hypothetical protein
VLLIASATVRFAGVALLLGFTSRFPSPGVPAGSFVLPKVCDALDEMRRERNLIAHGVWTIRFGGGSQGETAMPPAGLPMVLWHSKMLVAISMPGLLLIPSATVRFIGVAILWVPIARSRPPGSFNGPEGWGGELLQL